MTQLLQSEIFFFISSIGFIILGILVSILIVYCIRAVRSLEQILGKVESNIDTIGDATIDLIDDVRRNPFFRMLFPPKRHRKN